MQGEPPLVPNLLWDLEHFELWRQLVVEWFHNIPEGHAALFYDLFRVFSDEAEKEIRARWEDPYTWDTSAGKKHKWAPSYFRVAP